MAETNLDYSLPNQAPMSADVAAAFDKFPEDTRAGLQQLRSLIFEIAATLPQIGPVDETLKWGQPSYATPKVKAATPLRLGTAKGGGFALFAHCQSRVIADFASIYPGMDRIDGNRAILFDRPDQIDPIRHGHLIRSALTYHLKS